MTSEEINVIDVRPAPSARHLIVTDDQLRTIAQAVRVYCASSRADLKPFADQLTAAAIAPRPEPTGVRTVRIFTEGAEQPVDLTAVTDSDDDRWNLNAGGLWHRVSYPRSESLPWEKLLSLYAPLQEI